MSLIQKKIFPSALLAALFLLPGLLSAQVSERGAVVTETPHNLSVTGGRGVHGIKSTVESEICVFCHTPHHSNAVMPLWSRDLSDQTYVLYKPVSMVATLQQPRGASRLCLSCHDGTIALGLLSHGRVLDPNLKAFSDMPAIQAETDPRKNPNLGTDLSDDHPISFVYTPKPELVNPAALDPVIKLEQETYLECTSCHNPHNNRNGNFLVANTDLQRDALCTMCHIPAGWSFPESVHQTGGGRYDATTSGEVKRNGCMSCHLSHNAPGPVLQTGRTEEETCTASCHQFPPYQNIAAEFMEPFRHPVQGWDRKHEVTEQLPVPAANEHVECVDCHNPHRAAAYDLPLDSLRLPQPAFVDRPLISGPLSGVRTEAGSAVYEYQVCFKCHAGVSADSFAGIFSRPERRYQTFDEQERFASSLSSHPVVATNQPGFTGASLRGEYQLTMKGIYCVDCHHPHGSGYPHILKAANPDTFPATGTNPESDFPLCFSCHEPLYLFDAARNTVSASLHRKHVQGEYTTPGADGTRRVPCASCHDPHGLPAAGTDWSNLINFDKRYAGENPSYSPTFRSCSVTAGTAGACHAVAAPAQNY